jgi:hypothetical protein
MMMIEHSIITNLPLMACHNKGQNRSKVTRYVLSCADTSATYTREVEADIIPVVQEI